MGNALPLHWKESIKEIRDKNDNFRCPIWPSSTASIKGRFCPLEDTWEYLEKCLFVVMEWGQGSHWHLFVEVRSVIQRATVHRTGPPQKNHLSQYSQCCCWATLSIMNSELVSWDIFCVMEKVIITLIHGMYEDFPCFALLVFLCSIFLYEETSSPREALESAQQKHKGK